MSENWLADRTRLFDTSGIRKVFELGARLPDPINLSIGQPDFAAPAEMRAAAIEAIQQGRNGYSLSQGIPPLRESLLAEVRRELGQPDRDLLITSGTSGGLMLALLALVNPGEEVVVFDPYFVMYDSLALAIGARVVYVDTYPNFRIDLNKVEAAIGPRTKMILFNSPANPTGGVPSQAEVQGLAELAHRKGVVLLSDEIYRAFCYDRPFVSPARFNPHTLVIDGMSKSHGVPGWRLGFAHGPPPIIREMLKLQQYSFVCAPHPLQWGGLAGLSSDLSGHIDAYRAKRDRLVAALQNDYELIVPGGAFYAFPKAPWGTAEEFVHAAIERHQLLIIPGNVFSRKNTHFRISYAASDETIDRGIEALRSLARNG